MMASIDKTYKHSDSSILKKKRQSTKVAKVRYKITATEKLKLKKSRLKDYK